MTTNEKDSETKSKDKSFKKMSALLDENNKLSDIPNRDYGIFYPTRDELLLRRYLKENPNMPVYKGAFKKVINKYK